MTEQPNGWGITDELASGVLGRGVMLAYGETRTVDGADLIPVALVTYGFGASEASDRFGVGGGGGGAAIPLGAYVKTPQGVRFRANSIMVIATLIPLVGAIGLILTRLGRR